MCSALVKLTKSLPFCICTLWDTCPLPSKGAQVWRKYSSFKYLNPELYHHLIQIIHCLCLLSHIGLDLQPPARCPLGKSLFNEPMESEKSSSLQSNITKGFLVLSTMTQQTLQHWQNKIKKISISHHLETLQTGLETSRQLSVQCSHDSSGKGDDSWESSGCYLHVSLQQNSFLLPILEGIGGACCLSPTLSLSSCHFKGRVTEVLSTE